MFIVASSCKRCQKRDSIFNGQKLKCTGHELCMPVSLEQISINYPIGQTAGIWAPKISIFRGLLGIRNCEIRKRLLKIPNHNFQCLGGKDSNED